MSFLSYSKNENWTKCITIPTFILLRTLSLNSIPIMHLTTNTYNQKVDNHGKGDGFCIATEKIFLITKGLIWKLGELAEKILAEKGILSGPTNPAPSLHLLENFFETVCCNIQQNFTFLLWRYNCKDLLVGETNSEFCSLYSSMLFDIGKFSTFHLIQLIGHKGISGICRILQILDFISVQIGIKSIFYTFGLIGLIGSV